MSASRSARRRASACRSMLPNPRVPVIGRERDLADTTSTVRTDVTAYRRRPVPHSRSGGRGATARVVNVQTELATGVPFMSDNDLRKALEDANVPPETANAVVDENT